ncbi:hypothetical protein BJ912DRAFT_934386 [Pholiota molesta]|nr:hypothetical protein BJ912DRAFT_934386 [Pholiota molesta]
MEDHGKTRVAGDPKGASQLLSHTPSSDRPLPPQLQQLPPPSATSCCDDARHVMPRQFPPHHPHRPSPAARASCATRATSRAARARRATSCAPSRSPSRSRCTGAGGGHAPRRRLASTATASIATNMANLPTAVIATIAVCTHQQLRPRPIGRQFGALGARVGRRRLHGRGYGRKDNDNDNLVDSTAMVASTTTATASTRTTAAGGFMQDTRAHQGGSESAMGASDLPYRLLAQRLLHILQSLRREDAQVASQAGF